LSAHNYCVADRGAGQAGRRESFVATRSAAAQIGARQVGTARARADEARVVQAGHRRVWHR